MKYTTRENADGLWEIVIFNGKGKTPHIKVFTAKRVMQLWIWGNLKARKSKHEIN